MAANSQSVAVGTGSAVQVTSSGPYSDTIIIENGSNQTIYARADGTAAVVGANGTVQIPAGQQAEIANGQQLPDEDLKPNNSRGIPNTSTYTDISTLPGWTPQQGYQSTTLYSVAPNIVSFIPTATGTGNVTVTFQ